MKLLFVTGTKIGAGDNELIAAPGAGFRLVIVEVSLQNEGLTETTVILKQGSTAIKRFVLGVSAIPILSSTAQDREWRLDENASLVLNLSLAISIGYSVSYTVEYI